MGADTDIAVLIGNDLDKFVSACGPTLKKNKSNSDESIRRPSYQITFRPNCICLEAVVVESI